MIPLPQGMRRAVDRAIAAFAAVVVVLFATMVALVFLQVVDRFAGFGLFWTEEIVRSLLVWTVMLGLPVVLYNFQEIIVDVLSLKGRAGRWQIRLASAASLVFLVLLGWQGWAFAMRNAGFTSPTLGVSRAWLYAPIPIGAALGCLALIIRPLDRAPTIDEGHDT